MTLTPVQVEQALPYYLDPDPNNKYYPWRYVLDDSGAYTAEVPHYTLAADGTISAASSSGEGAEGDEVEPLNYGAFGGA